MALSDLNRSPRCQHVHFNGRPCKAPARRGRNFCVFHQAAHFDSGGCVLPIIEDVHSYQLAVIRILRALADDIIDSKKATALLYGLQLVGARLDQFVDQRATIEDPNLALREQLNSRQRSERNLKLTVDGIPKADLRRILSDLATEQDAVSEPAPTSVRQPAHSNVCHPERSEAPMYCAAAQNIDGSSDLRPPHHDTAFKALRTPQPAVISSEDEPTGESESSHALSEVEANLHRFQPAAPFDEPAGSSTSISPSRNIGAPAPSSLGTTDNHRTVLTARERSVSDANTPARPLVASRLGAMGPDADPTCDCRRTT